MAHLTSLHLTRVSVIHATNLALSTVTSFRLPMNPTIPFTAPLHMLALPSLVAWVMRCLRWSNIIVCGECLLHCKTSHSWLGMAIRDLNDGSAIHIMILIA